MIKYVDTLIGFNEVHNEISLCINISNCPCHCVGCHSAYLAEDIGENLSCSVLDKLIQNNKGITCVCLMGGDADTYRINTLLSFIKLNYPKLKTAWYSGRQELSKDIELEWLDYLKLGPYIEELGPLTNKNTNQRFYEIKSGKLNDITNKFYKND